MLAVVLVTKLRSVKAGVLPLAGIRAWTAWLGPGTKPAGAWRL